MNSERLGPVYARPAQTSYNPSTDQGGAHEVPPLAEELLTTGSFWESPTFFKDAGHAPGDGPTPYTHGPPLIASVG